MLYHYTIYPLELIYKALYLLISSQIASYGLALIVLSVITSLIIRPLMHWAGSLQADEKFVQDIMSPQLAAIKQHYKGAEQHEAIKRLYYRYSYHPILAMRSAVGVMLQLPFLMAAYYMLSALTDIQGQAFGRIITDLSQPDALLAGINLLPVLMTVINLGSTFTTPSFGRKDKIQASVIAVLFLIILYSAPSALLIYWTCNNLWGLLINVCGKLSTRIGFTLPQFVIARRTYWQLIKNVSSEDYIIVALNLTIFVFVPIDIYIINASEFWFGLDRIIGPMLLVAVLSSIVTSIVYHVLIPRKNHMICMGFTTALLLGFFIQSYVVNVDYGTLNGKDIDWNSFYGVSVRNSLIWLMCFVFVYLCYQYMKKEKFILFVKKIAMLCLAIQICSLAWAASLHPIKPKQNLYFSTDKMFELSSNNNIVVFILDTFENKEFERLITEHQELKKPFDGFTYYQDIVGSYPTTMCALPQILTGKWYDLSVPYQEYLDNSWCDNRFWKELHAKNYDCRICPGIKIISKEAEIDNIHTGDTEITSTCGLLSKYYEMTAFRALPHILKKYFVIYSGDFNNFKSHEEYRTDDVGFFQHMEKEVSIDSTKNCFRFYHLQGPHGPHTMTRDIQRRMDGSVTIDDQSIASLKIVSKFIEELKANNIYDETAIIVMSDHGNHTGEALVRSPLMLIKRQNEHGSLKTSSKPVSYENLHATWLAAVGNSSARTFGIPFFDKSNTQHRIFRTYLWKKPWRKEYGPYLEEYDVNGFVYNKESWHKTNKSFSILLSNQYTINDVINFKSGGNSENYINALDGGWSGTEKDFTWTEGEKATLSLNIEKASIKQLYIKLICQPYLGRQLKGQIVTVIVNGEEIGKWNIDKTGLYKMAIPENLINTEEINILFVISDPLSPSEEGVSKDTRKLGIAVKKLVISDD